MEIEVFALCDGAFNYGGKLTVVGTYDRLNIPTVPSSARVSLAVKLNFDDNEVRSGSIIKLSFKDSLGNLVSGDITHTVGALNDNTSIRHIAMAVNSDLNISVEGVHTVELYLNDTLMLRKDFTIAVNA